MSGAIAARPPRNQGIDLLRGLAIVLVIFNHLGIRIPLAKGVLAQVLPAHLLHSLNYSGYEAVLMFFVVSGFLITGHALRRWGELRHIDLRAFYVRRATRIVPTLLLLLLVLSVLHGLGVQDFVIHRPGQSLAGALWAALTLHLNWYEGVTGYLPGNWDVLWSLSIEEAFYLGFPLVCLATRRVWVLATLLVLLAASMPWTHLALTGNEIWQEKAYLPGMSAIAIGVIGALLSRRWPTLTLRQARALVALGSIGIAVETLATRWLWPLMSDGVLLLLTGSVMLMLIAFQARPIRVAYGLRWLPSWGRLSYEIYLSHMFVVFAIVRVYRAIGADARWGIAWYALALPLCWLLGWLVAHMFSQPCERWLRARFNVLTPRTPTPTVLAD